MGLMVMLALYNGRICGSWDSAFADCSAGPKKSWADNKGGGAKSPVLFF